MEKLISILVFLIIINSCSRDLTCEDFKNGEFLIPGDSLVEISYKVIRKSGQQIEIDDKGNEIILDINYIDDCNYILTLNSSSKNVNEYAKEMNKYGGTRIELVEINGRTMHYIGYWKIDTINYELPGKIVKLD